MKKIKIVWYWNSRLRCFRSKRKNSGSHIYRSKGFEVPGRISDSATVAGNYANPFCGVNRVGEDIMSNATAAKIATRVTDGLR
jgi:hypothetical protein